MCAGKISYDDVVERGDPFALGEVMMFASWLASKIHPEAKWELDSVKWRDTWPDLVREFGRGGLETRALEVADGCEIPAEAIRSDTAALRDHLGGLRGLIEARQGDYLNGKLSPVSVDALVSWGCLRERASLPLSQDIDRLRVIASEGAWIDVPDGFTPCTIPEPPRRLHRRIQSVINAHVSKLWKEGKCLLVDSKTLREYGSANVHYNAVHWTGEPSKPLGRLLIDCSNRKDSNVLNDRGLLPVITERYGSLALPDIIDVVDDIIQVTLSSPNTALHLWKEDVSGAFNQFKIQVDCAPLFSTEVAPGVSMVYLVGMFGWTGCPMVFGVFTRVLLAACRNNLEGTLQVYVDDFIGVSVASNAVEEQRKCRDAITLLFGSDGINEAKTVFPTFQGDVLGWFVDLQKMTLRPNDKSIRKLSYWFMSLPWAEREGVHRRTMEVVAALAARYSKGLVGMRPFVKPLFTALQQYGQRDHELRPIPHECHLSILVWRSICVLLLANRDSLAVRLTTLTRISTTSIYRIVSDASPEGVGVAIYYPSSNEIASYVQLRWPFSVTSQYQNVREYLAVLVMFVWLVRTGLRDCQIAWVGDNMSALTWVRSDYSSSLPAWRAFLAITWLSIIGRIRVLSCTHIPGIDMGCIDSLSRFLPHSLPLDNQCHLLDHDKVMSELLKLCDPDATFERDVEVMQQIIELVSIVCRGP